MAQNDANADPLTPRQRQAITALLAARTVTAAAESASIGRRTLQRWMKDPTFAAELARAESELLGAVVRGLLAHAGEAADVFAQVMADPIAGPGARIRAADLLLQHLAALRQQISIEDRLSALEDALAHAKPD